MGVNHNGDSSPMFWGCARRFTLLVGSRCHLLPQLLFIIFVVVSMLGDGALASSVFHVCADDVNPLQSSKVAVSALYTAYIVGPCRCISHELTALTNRNENAPLSITANYNTFQNFVDPSPSFSESMVGGLRLSAPGSAEDLFPHPYTIQVSHNKFINSVLSILGVLPPASSVTITNNSFYCSDLLSGSRLSPPVGQYGAIFMRPPDTWSLPLRVEGGASIVIQHNSMLFDASFSVPAGNSIFMVAVWHASILVSRGGIIDISFNTLHGGRMTASAAVTESVAVILHSHAEVEAEDASRVSLNNNAFLGADAHFMYYRSAYVVFSSLFVRSNSIVEMNNNYCNIPVGAKVSAFGLCVTVWSLSKGSVSVTHGGAMAIRNTTEVSTAGHRRATVSVEVGDLALADGGSFVIADTWVADLSGASVAVRMDAQSLSVSGAPSCFSVSGNSVVRAVGGSSTFEGGAGGSAGFEPTITVVSLAVNVSLAVADGGVVSLSHNTLRGATLNNTLMTPSGPRGGGVIGGGGWSVRVVALLVPGTVTASGGTSRVSFDNNSAVGIVPSVSNARQDLMGASVTVVVLNFTGLWRLASGGGAAAVPTPQTSVSINSSSSSSATAQPFTATKGALLSASGNTLRGIVGNDNSSAVRIMWGIAHDSNATWRAEGLGTRIELINNSVVNATGYGYTAVSLEGGFVSLYSGARMLVEGNTVARIFIPHTLLSPVFPARSDIAFAPVVGAAVAVIVAHSLALGTGAVLSVRGNAVACVVAFHTDPAGWVVGQNTHLTGNNGYPFNASIVEDDWLNLPINELMPREGDGGGGSTANSAAGLPLTAFLFSRIVAVLLARPFATPTTPTIAIAQPLLTMTVLDGGTRVVLGDNIVANCTGALHAAAVAVHAQRVVLAGNTSSTAESSAAEEAQGLFMTRNTIVGLRGLPTVVSFLMVSPNDSGTLSVEGNASRLMMDDNSARYVWYDVGMVHVVTGASVYSFVNNFPLYAAVDVCASSLHLSVAGGGIVSVRRNALSDVLDATSREYLSTADFVYLRPTLSCVRLQVQRLVIAPNLGASVASFSDEDDVGGVSGGALLVEGNVLLRLPTLEGAGNSVWGPFLGAPPPHYANVHSGYGSAAEWCYAPTASPMVPSSAAEQGEGSRRACRPLSRWFPFAIKGAQSALTEEASLSGQFAIHSIAVFVSVGTSAAVIGKGSVWSICGNLLVAVDNVAERVGRELMARCVHTQVTGASSVVGGGAFLLNDNTVHASSMTLLGGASGAVPLLPSKVMLTAVYVVFGDLTVHNASSLLEMSGCVIGCGHTVFDSAVTVSLLGMRASVMYGGRVVMASNHFVGPSGLWSIPTSALNTSATLQHEEAAPIVTAWDVVSVRYVVPSLAVDGAVSDGRAPLGAQASFLEAVALANGPLPHCFTTHLLPEEGAAFPRSYQSIVVSELDALSDVAASDAPSSNSRYLDAGGTSALRALFAQAPFDCTVAVRVVSAQFTDSLTLTSNGSAFIIANTTLRDVLKGAAPARGVTGAVTLTTSQLAVESGASFRISGVTVGGAEGESVTGVGLSVGGYGLVDGGSVAVAFVRLAACAPTHSRAAGVFMTAGGVITVSLLGGASLTIRGVSVVHMTTQFQVAAVMTFVSQIDLRLPETSLVLANLTLRHVSGGVSSTALYLTVSSRLRIVGGAAMVVEGCAIEDVCAFGASIIIVSVTIGASVTDGGRLVVQRNRALAVHGMQGGVLLLLGRGLDMQDGGSLTVRRTMGRNVTVLFGSDLIAMGATAGPARGVHSSHYEKSDLGFVSIELNGGDSDAGVVVCDGSARLALEDNAVEGVAFAALATVDSSAAPPLAPGRERLVGVHAVMSLAVVRLLITSSLPTPGIVVAGVRLVDNATLIVQNNSCVISNALIAAMGALAASEEMVRAVSVSDAVLQWMRSHIKLGWVQTRVVSAFAFIHAVNRIRLTNTSNIPPLLSTPAFVDFGGLSLLAFSLRMCPRSEVAYIAPDATAVNRAAPIRAQLAVVTGSRVLVEGNALDFFRRLPADHHHHPSVHERAIGVAMAGLHRLLYHSSTEDSIDASDGAQQRRLVDSIAELVEDFGGDPSLRPALAVAPPARDLLGGLGLLGGIVLIACDEIAVGTSMYVSISNNTMSSPSSPITVVAAGGAAPSQVVVVANGGGTPSHAPLGGIVLAARYETHSGRLDAFIRWNTVLLVSLLGRLTLATGGGSGAGAGGMPHYCPPPAVLIEKLGPAQVSANAEGESSLQHVTLAGNRFMLAAHGVVPEGDLAATEFNSNNSSAAMYRLDSCPFVFVAESTDTASIRVVNNSVLAWSDAFSFDENRSSASLSSPPLSSFCMHVGFSQLVLPNRYAALPPFDAAAYAVVGSTLPSLSDVGPADGLASLLVAGNTIAAAWGDCDGDACSVGASSSLEWPALRAPSCALVVATSALRLRKGSTVAMVGNAVEFVQLPKAIGAEGADDGRRLPFSLDSNNFYFIEGPPAYNEGVLRQGSTVVDTAIVSTPPSVFDSASQTAVIGCRNTVSGRRVEGTRRSHVGDDAMVGLSSRLRSLFSPSSPFAEGIDGDTLALELCVVTESASLSLAGPSTATRFTTPSRSPSPSRFPTLSLSRSPSPSRFPTLSLSRSTSPSRSNNLTHAPSPSESGGDGSLSGSRASSPTVGRPQPTHTPSRSFDTFCTVGSLCSRLLVRHHVHDGGPPTANTTTSSMCLAPSSSPLGTEGPLAVSHTVPSSIFSRSASNGTVGGAMLVPPQEVARAATVYRRMVAALAGMVPIGPEARQLLDGPSTHFGTFEVMWGDIATSNGTTAAAASGLPILPSLPRNFTVERLALASSDGRAVEEERRGDLLFASSPAMVNGSSLAPSASPSSAFFIDVAVKPVVIPHSAGVGSSAAIALLPNSTMAYMLLSVRIACDGAEEAEAEAEGRYLSMTRLIAVEVPVVYEPIPALIFVRDPVTEVIGATVGVVVISVGGVALPVAGMQQGTSMALLRMMQCEEDSLDGEPLDVLVHPLQFGLGRADDGYYARGAIIGNLFIVPIAWAFITWLVVPVIIYLAAGSGMGRGDGGEERRGPAPSFWSSASLPLLSPSRDMVGWPGIMIVPVALLCEGTMMASVGLLSYNESTAADKGLGAVGLVVMALCTAAWFRALYALGTTARRALVCRRAPKMPFPALILSARWEWLLSVLGGAAKQRSVRTPHSNRRGADPPLSAEDDICMDLLPSPTANDGGADTLPLATGGTSRDARVAAEKAEDEGDADDEMGPIELSHLKQRLFLIGDSWWLWASVVAHCFSMLVGVAEGMPSNTAALCRLRWALAAVGAVGQSVVLLTNTIPLELGLLGITSLTSCVLVVFVAVSAFGVIGGYHQGVNDAVNGVGSLNAVLGVVLMGVGVLCAVVEMVNDWRRRKGKGNAQWKVKGPAAALVAPSLSDDAAAADAAAPLPLADLSDASDHSADNLLALLGGAEGFGDAPPPPPPPPPSSSLPPHSAAGRAVSLSDTSRSRDSGVLLEATRAHHGSASNSNSGGAPLSAYWSSVLDDAQEAADAAEERARLARSSHVGGGAR